MGKESLTGVAENNCLIFPVRVSVPEHRLCRLEHLVLDWCKSATLEAGLNFIDRADN